MTRTKEVEQIGMGFVIFDYSTKIKVWQKKRARRGSFYYARAIGTRNRVTHIEDCPLKLSRKLGKVIKVAKLQIALRLV